MKVTFTFRKCLVEKAFNNAWQPLPIIVFTMFLSILFIPDRSDLLAGASRSGASEDKSEKEYGHTPPLPFQGLQEMAVQPTIEWDKTFGGNNSEHLYSTTPTPDGSYLLVGTSESDASGDKSENRVGNDDYWVVKTDADGNKVWDKTLGGSRNESCNSIIPTSDGGFLLAGSSSSPASGDKSENSKGDYDYWIVKIDAQGNKQWDKTLGGSDVDQLYSAIPTMDGGFLLAGYSNSPASGDKSEKRKGRYDYWVVKIDAQGNKMWDKSIGGENIDQLYSAIPTPDGGYLLAGISRSDASGDKSEDSKGDYDYWIVKLKDQNTPVVTSLTLVDAETDQEIRELKDGDVISLAEANSALLNIRANTSGPIDHVDLKLQGPISHTRTEQISPFALFGDMEGDYEGKELLTGKYTLTVTPYTKNKKGATFPVSFQVVEEDIVVQPTIEWDKTIGGSSHDLLFITIPTPDGGYLLAGHSESPASGDKSENRVGNDDYWVVKTDTDGNKVWDKTFGGSGSDFMRSVVPTSDGGYLLAGTSRSDASGDKSENSKGGHDYWIIKIDADGNKQWDKTIGGDRFDPPFSTIPTPDGGYLLAGESNSNASGDKSENRKGRTDYWIVKIDADGNKIWDKTIGGSRDDVFRSAVPTSDGGYLLTGGSNSNASGDKSENRKGECDAHGNCDTDYWVVKIDAQGNKIWDKTIGGSGNDISYSVIPTPDEGYLLGGDSESPASGDKSENSKGFRDYWVVKIDDQGNKIWDKTFGGSGIDEFSTAIPTPDGGYLLGGDTEDRAYSGERDYWIVKIDADGNKQWDKTFGGSGYEQFSSTVLTPDGGYLLGGSSPSNASGDKSENSKGGYDYWIVKLKDQNTPVVTSLTLVDAETDQEIRELKDGDVISLAEANSALLNIRANTSGPIDHVYLKLQGPVRVNRTERIVPYALFGDIEGDYGGRQLLTGKYMLTVTPYKGIAHTVSFEVIDAPAISDTASRVASRIEVYPVPTSGVLNILHEGRSEEAQLMLLDFGGNVLLYQPLRQQPVEQLNLSGFRKGIYYLKVVSPEAVQVFRVVVE